MPEAERDFDIAEDPEKNHSMEWPQIPPPEVPEKDAMDETVEVQTNEEDWQLNSVEQTGKLLVEFEEKVFNLLGPM